MDSRFFSATQTRQINRPLRARYPNFQVQNGHDKRGQSSSSASVGLDENLSRLFECMRLEYGTGGFLISPKWKNFRSQKLHFAEKTRLNNAIWRSWHIQYSKNKRPLFCQFVPPLSADKEIKKKPFTVILEGKYWRRKLEAVSREYKKLRIYYKKWSGTPRSSLLHHLGPRAQQLDREISKDLEERQRRRRTLSSGSDGPGATSPPPLSSGDTPIEQMLNMMDTSINHDMALSSLPDTLFTSRTANFGGTVIPEELSQQQGLASRATAYSDTPDVFQVPTLDSLQPNLDQFMEHFELFSMLVKQAENAGNQQNLVQPGNFQAVRSEGQTVFVNQSNPFDSAVQGHEEVMDHSGAYDATSQYPATAAATVDNAQLSQQGMPQSGHVLMDISGGNPSGEYSFDYGNVMHGQSFTAQLQQSMPSQGSGFISPSSQQHPTSPVQGTVLASPVDEPQMVPFANPQQQQHPQQQQQQQHLPSPLEEIQAQQLASHSGPVLSPTQYTSNTSPFNSRQQIDTSSQQRKGRLPRNVSDTQLYTMDLSQLATSFPSNLFPSIENNLPPQLEAPNLAAHLQSIPPRTRLTSIPPAASQPKRARLPRNMSDSRLSSMVRSPTSPPSFPTIQSAETTKQHPQQASAAPQSSRVSALRGRKQGRLPRNMSDSSLLNLGQQPQPVSPAVPSQRRRKMSDPRGVSVASLTASLQGGTMPSATFTSTAATQQFSTSNSGMQTGESSILEQLLSSPAGSNVVTTSSTESYQPASSSVLGQLLTQQSSVPTPAVQMPARDTNPLGGTQDPALLMLQLKQVLQSKQASSIPTELLNTLNSLTGQGQTQVAQHKQEQAQPMQTVPQPKPLPLQPSLQMKPQNQNAISQALQSLLCGPPNVALQQSTQPKQTPQVSSFAAQPAYQVPVAVTSPSMQVPSVTVKHQPQLKSPLATVILSPQGTFQPTQETRTEQASTVFDPAPTPPVQQVVNIAPAAVQGQRIILPANVNLSTLSLAQLGLSSGNLQTVSVTVPSSVAPSSPSLSSVATISAGSKPSAAVTVSTTGMVTESQDTDGMRPSQAAATPTKPSRPVTAQQREQYKEHRRISHITAEQKRRGNIKMGFDQLMSIVPSLANQRNAKVSKATVLQKTVEYTTKLQRERHAMQDEADQLRKQIQDLNTSISVCQQQLPATGVPVARQRVDQMWSMFNQYVKTRTQDNFKFWIFSVLMRQLFEEYNNMVSTVNVEEFCRTVLGWLEQHCSLPALRPAALSSLRDLSKATSILSDPSKVPEQALRASATRDPTDLAALMAPPEAQNAGGSGDFS